MEKIRTMIILGVALLEIFICASSKSIPSFLHVCKRNDPELEKCCIKTFNEIRDKLRKGIPELNIPPGEPLHYMNTSANSGKGSAVTIDVATYNQIATGLMDVEIKSLKMNLDNASWATTLFFPRLRIQGEYKIKGNILLLEIDTTGPFDLNATDLTARGECFGKFYTKHDKEYIEFDKVDLVVEFKNGNVDFSNLINGNEDLSITLNNAINDNLQSIKQELDPIIGQTFGGVARQYFNKFFAQFSVDELFPRD